MNHWKTLETSDNVGLIAAIELVKDKTTKEPYPWEERMGIQVCLEARKRGLLIRPLGHIIVIMPPLIIKTGELDRMLSIIYESIRMVTEVNIPDFHVFL